jgi:transcriptional regulator with XRE-family HTH domain
MTLAKRIHQARQQTGISRSELARQVGVKASAAAQWEYPKGTAPSVAHLAKIAIVTGLSFEWLATGRGVPRPLSLHEEPTVRRESIAMNLYEEQMLAITRAIPMKHQEALLQFLQAIFCPQS